MNPKFMTASHQDEIIDALAHYVDTFHPIALQDVAFLLRVIRRQKKQIKSLKKKVKKS